MATRPATLTAAIVPVLVGTAIASRHGHIDVGVLTLTLLATSLIQIGTNLVNDVADFEKGADTHERLGPQRVVQSGLLTPQEVKAGVGVTFALAAACGLALTWIGGWPILLIGILSILSGIAYTAGPYPLGYHGLGDIFVLVFFGVVAVCGTAYLQIASIPPEAIVASLSIGAIATAILVVNNVRDYETDVKAHKRTLVVRFGRQFGVIEYVLLMLVAYLVPLFLFLQHHFSVYICLPLISLPWAVWLSKQVASRRGAPLNPILAGTAKLLLIFGVLFAAGLMFPSLTEG